MNVLTRFLEQRPTKDFKKNEIILMQGDEPKHLYAIKSGYVKGYDISADGNEEMVWFGARSHIFPLPWAFSLKRSNSFFYAAFTDVSLYVVKLGDFLDFLESSPEASREMNNRMARWYFDLLRRLQATEKPKASDKLIYTLAFLSERFSRDIGKERVEVKIPFTHQDIANLIGLTRETATIELRKLKNKGYIYYNKHSLVIYPDRLGDLI